MSQSELTNEPDLSLADAGLFTRFRALKSDVRYQTLMFLAIGGGSALVYAFVCALVIPMVPQIPSWLAASAIYALFVPLVYILHRNLTFQVTLGLGVAFARYVLVQVGAVCVASLVSWLLFSFNSLPAFWVGLMVAGTGAAFGFVATRSWAFVDRKGKNHV